jgi:hypothetical protein
MRLSSLCLAVLVFSSIAFAQHHESSAPSSPPPSPAPSAAPSPAPTAAPSVSTTSTPSSPPSVSVSHSSAPSSPPSASPSETHFTPSTGSTTSHVSGSTSAESTISRPAPTAHTAASDSEHVIPAQKVVAEEKVAPAARIGENSQEREREVKPAQPDLRHRICEGEACKEPAPRPGPPESDLRRHLCVNGNCGCPAGQTAGKNGCVSAAVTSPANQCQPGESWNGGACLPSGQCLAGGYWNGVSCVASSAGCASFIGSGAILASELRSLKAQIQSACSQNPSGQECNDLKARQSGAVLRYQMLLTEAGPTCWTTLPDPLSLQ